MNIIRKGQIRWLPKADIVGQVHCELPAHVRDSRAGFLVGSVCGGSSSDDAGSSGGSK
jgi:hypothetical protein